METEYFAYWSKKQWGCGSKEYKMEHDSRDPWHQSFASDPMGKHGCGDGREPMERKK